MVVAGEAGVGKSRLVEELARTAEDQGIRVLVGRCVDIGDGELPYAPIAGALRGLLASLSEEDAEAVFGPDRAVLGRLVPELAGPDDGASDPAATFAKARLFELVLRTLGRLGERAPVLLVVEDLHWADGSTRDLLRFLVRSAVRERLALVLTCRTEGLARGHPLRPYLVELGRDPRVTRITLAPFTRAEFADHVAMLRATPLPAAALDRLYERSEGNAFYTEELLAAAGETGAGPLPASLAEALLLRLERLPGPARHVVRVAAAAGRRVDHELVARAAGLGEGELADALRAAVAEEVLVPSARGDAFAFRHALLREAAYTEVLPGERVRLHAALARDLEAHPELAGAGTAVAAELAHHWQAAGQREAALAACVRAGREAERSYAYPEALHHYQRALELATADSDDIDRVLITDAAAGAANATGEHALAIALSRRAIELVDARAEPLRAGLLHARLARFLHQAGRGDEARRLSAHAVELTPREPTRERALVLEAHARLLLLAGRVGAARPAVEEAIAIARAVERGTWRRQRSARGSSRCTGARMRPLPPGGRRWRRRARRRSPDAAARPRQRSGGARPGGPGRGCDRPRAGGRRGGPQGRRRPRTRHGAAVLRRPSPGRARPPRRGGHRDRGCAALVALRRGCGVAAPDGGRDRRAPRRRGRRRGGGRALQPACRRGRRRDVERARGGGPRRGRAVGARRRPRVRDRRRRVRRAGRRRVRPVLGPLSRSAPGRRSTAPCAPARCGTPPRRRRRGPPRTGCARGSKGSSAPRRRPSRPRTGRRCERSSARLEASPDAELWVEAGRRWRALGFRFPVAVCAWREAEALLGGAGDRTAAAERLTAARHDAAALGAQPLVALIDGLARRARISLVGMSRRRGRRPPSRRASPPASARSSG